MITTFLLIATLFSTPSRYTSVEVDISWDDGVKETTVWYKGIAGDDGRFLRVSRDFDPEYMEVEVIGSSYGFASQHREVPEWAVDTLTGSTGWPLAVVIAFPGLRPGMTMEWGFKVRDAGNLSEQGLFYTYIAGSEPDTILVTCPNIDTLSIGISGFTMDARRNKLHFESIDQASRELWLSTASSWQDVQGILMEESMISSAATPPDLREAAIEAGAAGALPQMRISRGRVLITESMQLLPFPGGDAGFKVRPLQEILDSRRATPIEAATLLSAMCRVMSIEAPVVPATDILPIVPSPYGFYRAFILVDGELEEPSEYLSPAGWIDTPDTLWLLLPNGTLIAKAPQEEKELCEETWSIAPQEGKFSLSIKTEGGFDRELRRRLAGQNNENLLLTISEWFRSSNIYFYPDSVELSDFFDLTKHATMTVSGFFLPAPESWIERAPALQWNRAGEVQRNYNNVNLLNGMISQ